MPIENYAEENMISTSELQSIKITNEVLKKQLQEFSKNIKITHITNTLLQ
jgi:hypothetical protein